ncbi:MAG: rod shape-determining protein MreD [Gammaproteobacteria bacterium]|nr:MAG: rod shape-determining protein MreD [Gammaproteobacteria bacterium]TND06324.1 MAG: rod shape-determining protein MreD [Gammaproteobacteria bacterium]
MLVRRNGGWIIVLSFVVALLVTIVPLPGWAGYLWPEWVAIVLVYWCIALPHRVGVFVGFGAGLMLDVLVGTVLGQHAMGLSVVAFLSQKLHRRIRNFPLWQQALTVLLLIAFHKLLMAWVNGFTGQPMHGALYWISPLVSMLIWPTMFLLLRGVRRRFRVT